MNQKLVSRITLFLFLFLLFLIFIYAQSLSGMALAQQEVRELVSLCYPNNELDRFYWFSMDESYFSMSFIDEEGQYRYAIINQDGGDTSYFTADDIISHSEAYEITEEENNPKEILEVRLGMMDDKPIWEVSFLAEDDSLSYYYIDAADGEWIQTIGNL